MTRSKKAIAQALEQVRTQRRNEFLSQVGYCRAGDTAGHYILIENYGSRAHTKGWWIWRRLIIHDNGLYDIHFSEPVRYDHNHWFDSYFNIFDEDVCAFCEKSQVEFAPTEEIRDIVILRLFEDFVLEGPDGRPVQSLNRKSKNPAGRFLSAEGFHALATEIDASVTPDPEYMLENNTITITQLSEIETVRESINNLASALRARYDYSLALRQNVIRSHSEELGEMKIQEISGKVRRFNFAWTPWCRELSEVLLETEVQETLTTLTSTLAAYGYYLTARPLVLPPDIEDPWAEFR